MVLGQKGMDRTLFALFYPSALFWPQINMDLSHSSYWAAHNGQGVLLNVSCPWRKVPHKTCRSCHLQEVQPTCLHLLKAPSMCIGIHCSMTRAKLFQVAKCSVEGQVLSTFLHWPHEVWMLLKGTSTSLFFSRSTFSAYSINLLILN